MGVHTGDRQEGNKTWGSVLHSLAGISEVLAPWMASLHPHILSLLSTSSQVAIVWGHRIFCCSYLC